MCKRLNDNALHSTAVWRRSSLSECVHRCRNVRIVVWMRTSLFEDVHRCRKVYRVVWMRHRCLNGSTVIWMRSSLSEWVQRCRKAQPEFRTASFRPPHSELYSLGSCPRGRHTTFWLNRHDSVNSYIVLFLSCGYRPEMRLILNFSKLFLKIVWKYRFFIYLCIVVVLNVSNLEQWKHP